MTVLPKNTVMNSEWYKNVLSHQLLPTIQMQFGNDNFVFQQDGTPCHKSRAIKEFLRANSIEVLAPWPGNSPDLNPIENLWAILKKQVDKQKPTNCKQLQTLIQYEWSSIHSELINKLVSSMPKQIKEVLRKNGQHCKY